MRGKSHEAMGWFLVRAYMPWLPEGCVRAFLIGCIQPDRNPSTYLKGSIRSQWLRGHNYRNAQRYMTRLAGRLEGKDAFSLWDCYCLGKLIHYTMDAFTYSHNSHFPRSLTAHRVYEVQLQRYFLNNIRTRRVPARQYTGSAVSLIRSLHAQYMQRPGSIEADTAFAFTACCCLVQNITANRTTRQEYPFHSLKKDGIL